MKEKATSNEDVEYKSVHVTVNRTVWDILFVPETYEELKCDDEDREYFGICLIKKAKIYVSIMDIQAMRDSLMHELTHAVFFSYFGTNGQVLNNEEVCNFMACYGDMIVDMTNRVMKEYEDSCKANECHCDNCTCDTDTSFISGMREAWCECTCGKDILEATCTACGKLDHGCRCDREVK